MVGIKEAVQKATTHLADLVGVPPVSVLLEEVERTRDNGQTLWNITLSYPARPGIVSDIAAIGAIFGANASREYKIVQIDAETGELEAMKQDSRPMNKEYLRLVRLHRNNGLLVDANLLLLLIVGRFDKRLIPRFDRTSDFLVEDYHLLEGIVRQFSRIISTPHVLTEVSNLTTKLAENVRFSFRNNLRQTIDVIDERNCSAKNAVANEYFRRVGLTDAAILSLADRRFLLLTTDFALAQITQRTGGDVVNFNHLRPIAWVLADTFRARSQRRRLYTKTVNVDSVRCTGR